RNTENTRAAPASGRPSSPHRPCARLRLSKEPPPAKGERDLATSGGRRRAPTTAKGAHFGAMLLPRHRTEPATTRWVGTGEKILFPGEPNVETTRYPPRSLPNPA